MTMNKACKTDIHAANRKRNNMCQLGSDPLAKKVEVYTSVNNAWKRSSAATVVEAV